jgi:hypothetical protein
MLAKIAFPHHVEAVPPRCRNAQVYNFLSETTVEFAEIQPDDAPIAFRISRRRKPFELRWRDGKVWWPVREEENVYDDACLPQQTVLDDLAAGKRYACLALGLHSKIQFTPDWPTEKMEQQVFREVQIDNVHEMEAVTPSIR